MSEVISKLVNRSEVRSYMNTAAASSAESYTLMGEGFTSLSESKNAQEYSRKYVHENTERTDVVGYAPSVAYSVDVYTNNPVIQRIRDVTDKELVGTAAQVDIVTVEHFDGEATARKAVKRRYAIIPDAKGDGTDALVYTGSFRAVGDLIEGTWSEEGNTFTAATPAT